MAAARHIIAMGGRVLFPESTRLERYILEVSGKSRPRVLFVPTASGDDANYIANFYATYSSARMPPFASAVFSQNAAGPTSARLAQDVVHVGGGNTRSMLAVWRDWGLDAILRDGVGERHRALRVERRLDLLVRAGSPTRSPAT